MFCAMTSTSIIWVLLPTSLVPLALAACLPDTTVDSEPAVEQPVPCGGDLVCTVDQLCVVPTCTEVAGEICIAGPVGSNLVCPAGTKHAPQFDGGCDQGDPNIAVMACVGGCPPEPPFCVDLPSDCSATVTCGCLTSDPCQASNSGTCHDVDIRNRVLRCSIAP